MNFRQQSGIVLSILMLALAALGYGVFTNVISDMWGEDIQRMFRDNKWLLVVLAVALAALGYWYAEGLKKEKKEEAETIDEDRFQKALREFREELIIQYQLRLNNKISDRLPVNLAARSTDFGTSEERARLYFDQRTIESADIASEAGKILETVRRLLIIGEPGAGKTTIVLYTALDLLRDEKHPRLPLILNLATWHSNRDFEAWYVQNVAQSYNLSPLFAKDLLRRNLIVPVFDGFDEIHEKHRDDCLLKMKAWFGDLRERRLIVCSRKAEYAAAQADAPVYCELEVQPLTLEQIRTALSQTAERQRADRALLDALERDELLRKAVETPFYLNTASYLFGQGERTWADFGFVATDEAGRKKELEKRFVTGQLPAEQDRRYLRFLAGKMKEKNFLVLEMLSLQPDWCEYVWKYRIALGTIGGLIFGLFEDINHALLGFLIYAFIEGSHKIVTADIQKWNWKKLKKNWTNAFTWTMAGLILGTVMHNVVEGIFTGIGMTFIGLYLSAIDENYAMTIVQPYQRFCKTWFNYSKGLMIIMFIFFVLSLMLLTLVGYETTSLYLIIKFFWIDVILIIIFLPLLVWSKILNHVSLRLVLYLEHKIPLRLVTFLDRMSDQRIFEDNRRLDKKGRTMRGASWRFRHKILQDYFAEMGE